MTVEQQGNGVGQILPIIRMRDFQWQKELGSGSFGRVGKVRHRETGEVSALKQIKMNTLCARDRDNALNQVRLLASIDCPNIIQYRSAFFEEQDNSLCIVMEFADGGDLAGLIKKKAQKKLAFTQKFIWQVAFDLLKGLKTLHASKIIHRDVKPANVFFVEGVAKLGDLNVSKVLQGRFTTTQTGTPYYTPPQIWNNLKYDGKCDIWALGCLLYELAALHPPFVAKDIPSLAKRVNLGLYDTLPMIYSPRLARLVKRCLNVRMTQRPSAYQLLQDEVFSAMDTQEQGQIDLIDTIHCPKVLKLLQKKLPQIKSTKRLATQKSIRQQVSHKNISLKNIDLNKENAEKPSILQGPFNSPKSLVKLPKIGTKKKLDFC